MGRGGGARESRAWLHWRGLQCHDRFSSRLAPLLVGPGEPRGCLRAGTSSGGIWAFRRSDRTVAWTVLRRCSTVCVARLAPAGLGARGADAGRRHWISPGCGGDTGACRPAASWVAGCLRPAWGGLRELIDARHASVGLALGPGGLGDVAGQACAVVLRSPGFSVLTAGPGDGWSRCFSPARESRAWLHWRGLQCHDRFSSRLAPLLVGPGEPRGCLRAGTSSGGIWAFRRSDRTVAWTVLRRCSTVCVARLAPAGLGARGADAGRRHWISPGCGGDTGACRPAASWVAGCLRPAWGGLRELIDARHASVGLALGPGGLGDVAGQVGPEELSYLLEL
ncbi:hypothetical protein NDU88_003789 [Pleurodeles waltl]|uniref:Uncharacterized protein n=1 Tax=Pleurodeles waltl TaxID=8319 RepID=A0AAV7WQ32_PLEWA|nr:hypothetical protein NDU88_003789 [Pleurodeles waltl]